MNQPNQNILLALKIFKVRATMKSSTHKDIKHLGRFAIKYPQLHNEILEILDLIERSEK